MVEGGPDLTQLDSHLVCQELPGTHHIEDLAEDMVDMRCSAGSRVPGTHHLRGLAEGTGHPPPQRPGKRTAPCSSAPHLVLPRLTWER